MLVPKRDVEVLGQSMLCDESPHCIMAVREVIERQGSREMEKAGAGLAAAQAAAGGS